MPNHLGDNPKQLFEKTLQHLGTKKRSLFLTTSNRWKGEKHDIPKSTQLANKLQKELSANNPSAPPITIINIPDLNIHPCEGNVSTSRGNTCGEPEANLPDPLKNPFKCHRCWASINNPDDELWKVSKELLASDCVIFFGAVRWGQMNSFYQKLIERLTWLENRHSTFGEENLLTKIDVGLIITGHNWNEEEVLETQKQVLKFFGFNVAQDLCWYWRFTDDPTEESQQSYIKAAGKFKADFNF
ncbi:hypothetical protein KBB06_02815 [Candidatus Gracilibacteria bacterium]|nr:hypothetical protein [Candidatus Gracilibacteria bacterium]